MLPYAGNGAAPEPKSGAMSRAVARHFGAPMAGKRMHHCGRI
jgi:hypothetical protein